MGLKSGSRDAGLDDDAPEERTDGADAQPAGEAAESTRDTGGGDADAEPAADGAGSGSGSGDTDGSDGSGGGRLTVESLPYTLRRDTVNEGRNQVPFFLREEVVDGEADLQDALEDALGEEVYKSDYREAAMVVAQRNPDLVAEVLREWGYDLDAA